ncbi:MAG: LEPR-XLL domain-containing protein, partial [Verrucomicrobiae bacterium]|nr:LEPR-XLL domain-containing protein [Verrucomicrobiae bacterium]
MSDLESECLSRKRLFQLEMLEPRVLLSAAPIDAPGDLVAANPELTPIEVVEESAFEENAQTPAEQALAPVVSGEKSSGQEALFDGVETASIEPSSVSDSTLSGPAKETEDAIENAVSGAEESEILPPISDPVLDAGDDVSPLPNEADDFTNQDVQVPENKGPPGSESSDNELLNPDFSTNSNGSDDAVTEGSVLENSPVEGIETTESGTGLAGISDSPVGESGGLGKLPELPGIILTEGSEGASLGQVFYLNFDGASNASYDGPVQLSGLEIPAFGVEGLDAAERDNFIAEIVANLNELFGEAGIRFVTESPTDSSEFSTVYIGGTNEAFLDWGSFRGLAEHVDVGNLDRNDESFVFAESIWEPGMTVEAYADELTEVIAEESAHLIGYAETDDAAADSPLYSVAIAETKIIDMNFIRPVTGQDWIPTISFGISTPGYHTLAVFIDNVSWILSNDAEVVFSLENEATGESVTRVPLVELQRVVDGFTEIVFQSAGVYFPLMGTYTATFDALLAPPDPSTSPETVKFEIYDNTGTVDSSNAANTALDSTTSLDIWEVDVRVISPTTNANNTAQNTKTFSDEVADSDFAESLFNLALAATGKTIDFASLVAGLPQTQAGFAAILASLPQPATELEFGLGLEGEIVIGPAAPGGEGGVRAAEIVAGLKFVYSPNLSALGTSVYDFADGKLKITRVGYVSIGLITVEVEQYVEFGANPLDILNGVITENDQITIGTSFAVKPELVAEADAFEFFNFLADFSFGVEGVIKIETKMSIGEYLDLYVANDAVQESYASGLGLGVYPDITTEQAFENLPLFARFSIAVADLMIPYYADSAWQGIYGTAFPLAIPLDLYLERPDSFYGILTASPNPTVYKIEAGLGAALAFGTDLSFEASAAVGSAQAGGKIFVGGALKGTVTVYDSSAAYYSPVLNSHQEYYGAVIDNAIVQGTFAPATLNFIEPAVIRNTLSPYADLIDSVTIITHGEASFSGEDTLLGYFYGAGSDRGPSPGDDLRALALAIHSQGTGFLLDYDVPSDRSDSRGQIDVEQSIFATTDQIDAILEARSLLGTNDEISGAATGLHVVLLFDWAPESNNSSGGWASAAGEALVALMADLGLLNILTPGGNPNYHFIGEGTGAVVTSEAVRELGAMGISVDHLTYLDPRDYDGNSVGSRSPEVWDNVGFADVYYQTDDAPIGRAVPASYSVDVTGLGGAAINSIYDFLSSAFTTNQAWTDYYLPTVADPDVHGSISGYGYSLLAGGLASRPPPNQTGSKLVPGLAAFDINNGDLEFTGEVTGNTIPGWSLHGGGGSAESDSGGYLIFTNTDSQRIHNRILVPKNVGAIAFDLALFSTPGAIGSLKIDLLVPSTTQGGDLFSPVLLGTVELSVLSSTTETHAVLLPPEAWGNAYAISFTLVTQETGVELGFDNLRFVHGGGVGDAITVDFHDIGGGSSPQRQLDPADFDYFTITNVTARNPDGSPAFFTTPFDNDFTDMVIGDDLLFATEPVARMLYSEIFRDDPSERTIETGELLFLPPTQDDLLGDLSSLASGFQGFFEIEFTVEVDGNPIPQSVLIYVGEDFVTSVDLQTMGLAASSDVDLPDVGSLSAQYETGFAYENYSDPAFISAAGVVSSGVEDAGGVSYGVYQLPSRRNGVLVEDSRVMEFLNASGFISEFTGLTQATPAFNQKWMDLANPSVVGANAALAFATAQHDFVGLTDYDPFVAKFLADFGIDFADRSRALQNVVWSTGVQHKTADSVFAIAARDLLIDLGFSYSDAIGEAGKQKLLQMFSNGFLYDSDIQALQASGKLDKVVHNTTIDALLTSANFEPDAVFIAYIYLERGADDNNDGIVDRVSNSGPSVSAGLVTRYFNPSDGPNYISSYTPELEKAIQAYIDEPAQAAFSTIERTVRIEQRLKYRGFSGADLQVVIDAYNEQVGYQTTRLLDVSPAIDHRAGLSYALLAGGNNIYTTNWNADLVDTFDDSQLGGNVEDYVVGGGDVDRQDTFDNGDPADSVYLNPFDNLGTTAPDDSSATFYQTAGGGTRIAASTDADLDSDLGADTHVVAYESGTAAQFMDDAVTDPNGDPSASSILVSGFNSVLESAENSWLVLKSTADSLNGNNLSTGDTFLVKLFGGNATTGELFVDWSTLENRQGQIVTRDLLMANGGAYDWSLAYSVDENANTGTELAASAVTGDFAMLHALKYLIIDNADLSYNRSLARSIIQGFLAPALTDRGGTYFDDDGYEQTTLATLTGAWTEAIFTNDPRLWSLGANVLPAGGLPALIGVKSGVPDLLRTLSQDVAGAIKTGLDKFIPGLSGIFDTITQLEQSI